MPIHYHPSDKQFEHQINDYMSGMRFLDLTISDGIPDSRMKWSFNERSTELGLLKELFDFFESSFEKFN